MYIWGVLGGVCGSGVCLVCYFIVRKFVCRCGFIIGPMAVVSCSWGFRGVRMFRVLIDCFVLFCQTFSHSN